MDEKKLTVAEFCLHHTNVGELVVIRDSGYILGAVWIDAEDLFYIPKGLLGGEVVDDKWGDLTVTTEHGDRVHVPCHYLDIERK